MPLHLQSIANADHISEIIVSLLAGAGKDPDSISISKDKYIHTRFFAVDSVSGQSFGKIVYTMKIDEEQKGISVIDIDIVLNNPNAARLRFLGKRRGSSDANEYYDAETTAGDARLQIETVNRHVLEEELVNTEREVSISAFPFELTIYDDIEDFNRFVGFGTEIPLRNTGIKVCGFSDRFMMPGGGSEENESYTFLLGTVVSFRRVSWRIEDKEIAFEIALLDTALGIIPVAMSRDVFNLSKLSVGKIVTMKADIKADFCPYTNILEIAR